MCTIAHLRLSSPLILAPLAGYSDLPFRILCREFGAGLCVSEMISCHGLVYQQKKTLQMLASVSEEKPVSFQLFGADIYTMAKAADLLNEFKPDLVDINMGCPVKKVTKKGAGAALMATPKLARQIICEVVQNSESPVTVKFRTGVSNQSETCIDFGKMAEQSGAAAITVHGRNWAQAFTGSANWETIGRVKSSVSIPVIGNGDITNYDDARKKIANSGCDGVMIGRAALGNPWVFCKKGRPVNYAQILPGVLRHLYLMECYLDVNRLFAVVKNHIGRYFKNLEHSSTIRKQVYECKSFSDLKHFFTTISEKPILVKDQQEII
ncbi:MAG: tRNA dihydrouridine synthase DusB [Desulfocapsaceae bacterium]|nr:tRNA dihydrouridine synthase DusB [Desulfocapsaceae bacterium]